jgi:hypothetical protein
VVLNRADDVHTPQVIQVNLQVLVLDVKVEDTKEEVVQVVDVGEVVEDGVEVVEDEKCLHSTHHNSLIKIL